ncbi:MAG: energy transducer TonB, partial [Candidatus Accumulibacter sp.]|nr:energy transducer TonB [Accumulibacter sp.]
MAPGRMVVATINDDRMLWLAFGVSLLLHGAVLSLHFGFPEVSSRAFQGKALDIVLVNARSERKPGDAQVLAQANLDGGGASDEDRIASTPLPPSPRQQAGDNLEQARRHVQALEAQQRHLLTRTAWSEQALPPPDAVRLASGVAQSAPSEQSTSDGSDLANRMLEMARLEGVIARNIDEYNKRPRVKTLGARAEEYRFARYMEDWRVRVERIGTLNYP